MTFEPNQELREALQELATLFATNTSAGLMAVVNEIGDVQGSRFSEESTVRIIRRFLEAMEVV